MYNYVENYVKKSLPVGFSELHRRGGNLHVYETVGSADDGPLRWARGAEMDPIDVRVDTTLTQALRCVEFRLPRNPDLHERAYLLALGQRYALVGVAAAHHLLLTEEGYDGSSERDRKKWRSMVEQHMRQKMVRRLAFPCRPDVPPTIGAMAELALNAHFTLYCRLCPLNRALELIGDALTTEHKNMALAGWPWFRRKAALRILQQTLRETMMFAIHFFERRQEDLEEVSEIALIGE